MKPIKSKDLVELLALADGQIDFLIGPHLLARGGSMILYGKAGVGKSWLVTNVAFELARGAPWLGFPAKKCRVMIVQGEQAEKLFAERMMDYVKEHKLAPGELRTNIRFINNTQLRLDSQHGWAELEREIKEWRPDVVIFDCLYQFIASETDQVCINRFTDGCTYLQDRYGVASIIVHHPRKADRAGGDDHGEEEMGGMSSLNRWVDTLIRVNDVGLEMLMLDFQKQKLAKKAFKEPLYVQREGLTFKVVERKEGKKK